MLLYVLLMAKGEAYHAPSETTITYRVPIKVPANYQPLLANDDYEDDNDKDG